MLGTTKRIYKNLKYNPKKIKTYFLCYTLLFLISAFLVFFQFIIKGRSFIWVGGSGNMDGISQHYTALSYWGTYLRDIVKTFFTTGNLSLPMFDTSIGMGGDIIQTLSYYVIGDPLTLTSALVPVKYTEILYNFLIIVRLYLAGLSFSALALHFKKTDRSFTLVSSMVYVFSSYALFAAVRHPYFTNPMIYFPLIVLGVEYVFEGRKPWLFILSIALAGISNFYFFYMICFLTVGYAVVRVFSFAPKGERKKIFGYLWRFVVYALLGVMMASVLLYPSLRTTLGSSRMAQKTTISPLYSFTHYKEYFFSLVNTRFLDDWCVPGHLPLSALAIVIMWLKPKKNKTQIVLFCVCTVMLLVPIFGWFFNGMSYVSNRWIWAYGLLVSMICVFHLPTLATLKVKQWIVLATVVGAYVYISITMNLFGANYHLAIAGLTSSLIALLIINLAFRDPIKRKQYTSIALVALSLLQVSDFGNQRYHHEGYINEFMKNGNANKNIVSAQASRLNLLNDNSFYRYEDYFNNDMSKQTNAALVNGGNSTNSYFSLSSDYWYELLYSLADKNFMVQKTQGMDNKTILGSLSNVKYFTCDNGKEKGVVPYGYNKTPFMTAKLENHQQYRSYVLSSEIPEYNDYNYYENLNALPLGYTYSNYITRSEYDSLSYVDKQTALLYNAIINDDVKTNLSKGTLPETTEPVDIKVTTDKNVEKSGQSYITYSKGTIKLTLNNAQPNKETYLIIRNIQYDVYDPVTSAKNQGTWESLSTAQQSLLKIEAMNYSKPTQVKPTVKMLNTEKVFTIVNDNYTYYSGIRDYCLNLGYYEETPENITIELPIEGIYTLKDIEVVQLDLTGYEEQIKTLGAEHLENIEFYSNCIKGNIEVSEPKMLCISIPYSIGWKAYVDGKEVEIINTDIAFMGIELTKGSHSVELIYRTPYLFTGAALSGAGITIFAVWFFIDRRKTKKKNIISAVNE